MAILFTVLIVLSTTALDDMTTPNTYTSNSILTAAQLNEDNDSTRLPYNRLLDTLDARFVRFSDLEDGDSTLDSLTVTRGRFTWLSADTITSTTGDISVDNITGDSIRGAGLGIGRAVRAGYLIDVYSSAADAGMGVMTDDSTKQAWVQASGNNDAYVTIEAFGDNHAADTRFGMPVAGAGFCYGTGTTRMGVGTTSASSLVLGTNDTARLTINGSGDSLKVDNVTTLAASGTAATFGQVGCDSIADPDNVAGLVFTGGGMYYVHRGTDSKVTFNSDGIQSTLIDTCYVQSTLTVGPGGSVLTEVSIVDGAADTLTISSGGKTWKFVPVANQ